MATTPRLARHKISTTISPDSAAYLEDLIRRGKAANLAEAIDLALGKLARYENRERLARDTAAYFNNMSDEESAEEQRLEAALTQSTAGINFDE